MRLFARSIRPPDDIVPNPNDPASVPPSTVGPDQLVNPGDPNGVLVAATDMTGGPPPSILPSAWSGWPADWWPPLWNGHVQELTDTAWTCVDLNASVLASMPPYLVGAAESLDAEWMRNPEPDTYTSWVEFSKQLFWDYMLGEAFVLATSRYATGYPARFYVVPPWAVEIEISAGRRRYAVGQVDVTADMLHIRYQGSVDDAHGHGPLEAGAGRLVAAQMLARYASNLAAQGGIPASVLTHPDELSAEQSADLQQQWVIARQSSLGMPAVLSGGVTWEATQFNPTDMALLDLSRWNESRIAVMLGVPPFLVGLPSGADSLTYSTTESLFDYHWRAGLRPKAEAVMNALSEWLLPRGTRVELNRDAYVQPGPKERAETAKVWNSIVDQQGNPALSVDEIRRAERLANDLPEGVLQ